MYNVFNHKLYGYLTTNIYQVLNFLLGNFKDIQRKGEAEGK